MNVHVLSCGLVPYPNDDLVRDLQSSFAEDRLCEIRDTLFRESSVRTNAETFPATYDGRSLGNDNRLSSRQLSDLRSGLGRGRTLKMDVDTLVACKIILGRWLRPSEMTALFGERTRIVMQRYSLTGASGPRISHVIGRAGETLNRITREAGCVYIWFGKRAVVSVYGRTGAVLERARTLLNRHQAAFRGSPKMVVQPGTSSPRAVTLRSMYQVMNNRSK